MCTYQLCMYLYEESARLKHFDQQDESFRAYPVSWDPEIWGNCKLIRVCEALMILPFKHSVSLSRISLSPSCNSSASIHHSGSGSLSDISCTHELTPPASLVSALCQRPQLSRILPATHAVTHASLLLTQSHAALSQSYFFSIGIVAKPSPPFTNRWCTRGFSS